ncbi:MFS transporter, SP family, solute carrier family 2 (myo-inositol transporter), member 13 [Kwoniella mangroviensis CBS 10435]|uniref:MFS transporter, SP family, solute carrier family 2 (Myo-inositol transporter), member 13 n=1 Tax=Kwoniella mangroviensis CBS 10435 TaxID=1331196 RepID=A0A1B9IP99_9TREE|nr:MFS transporter, SP family, solute carrier family 2 (myo-inositol transporter), member 13 [Kwoniella mangroviensis CBS 10435]
MTRTTSSTSPTSSVHYPNTSPITSSTQPLLSGQPDLELEDETDSAVEHRRGERASMDNQVDEGMIQVKGEDRITKFVWTLVFTAAISGLLFGYDTAAISGVLVIIKDDLGGPLTDWQKEAITSSTTFGALLGGLLAGGLSDYTGRRLVIVLANAVFILGSLIQAAFHSVPLMITGRFIVGLGVGLASCIVPLYIGELAPTKTRGRLVTMNAVVVTLGQVVAYAIGASFQNINNGWRWIVGLGALPAMIQLASIGFLPESPRILLLRSNVHAAHRLLSKIYPSATTHQIDQKVEIMRRAVQQSKEITDRTTFRQRLESLLRIGGNRRALIIGCGLQISQQFCGFNTLMYYSATLFAALGFKNATAVGMVVAFVNFLFTLVALRIIDPIGRRMTMLLTLPVMIVALILVAFFLHVLTSQTGGVLVEGSGYPLSTSLLVLLSMLVYVAGYATGLGNIPWQQGELFRLEVRGIGTSISTATCWTGNLIIAGTFLSLMNAITPSGAFGLYAFFCTLSWLFCYFLYPETSGLSLEEVSFVFEDDFGVLKSQQIRREKLEKAKMAEVDRLIGDEVGV